MLRDTVEHDPQREALAETGGGPRLTYGELWDRAARVAGGLRAAGIGRGDRVAIHLGNGVDWVLAFFGTVLAGGVVVPVNTRLAEDEVNYMVTDSGAAYVFREGGSPSSFESVNDTGSSKLRYSSRHRGRSGTTGHLFSRDGFRPWWAGPPSRRVCRRRRRRGRCPCAGSRALSRRRRAR
jgi:long-chain acyl-CoA synthetase